MWILYHDIVWPHVSKYITKFLTKENIMTVPHPAYSLDLAPCNFWLFPTTKEELCGQQFSSDKEVTNVVQVFLTGISEDEFEKTIITQWEERMRKCVTLDGRYIEKKLDDSDSK